MSTRSTVGCCSVLLAAVSFYYTLLIERAPDNATLTSLLVWLNLPPRNGEFALALDKCYKDILVTL